MKEETKAAYQMIEYAKNKDDCRRVLLEKYTGKNNCDYCI